MEVEVVVEAVVVEEVAAGGRLRAGEVPEEAAQTRATDPGERTPHSRQQSHVVAPWQEVAKDSTRGQQTRHWRLEESRRQEVRYPTLCCPQALQRNRPRRMRGSHVTLVGRKWDETRW